MAIHVQGETKRKESSMKPQLTTFIFLTFFQNLLFGQFEPGTTHEGTRAEIAAGPADLGKPPVYPDHSPCIMEFRNITNAPLQISAIRKDGKLEKLYYLPANGTIRFPSYTNIHHIVVHNGFTAGPMFIPFADVNVCIVHDKHFNITKKISPKKYTDPDDGFKTIKFKTKTKSETYGKGKGPIIYFDEAHVNTYRITDRFAPLASLLTKDGYQVLPYKINFTDKGLATGKIMVMGNPWGQTVNGWKVDSVNTLTTQELSALREWVTAGGRLLLITDHTPHANRSAQIAKAFGFEILKGQVIDTSATGMASLLTAELGNLGKHVIFEGRNDSEKVDQVGIFTGTAIKIPEKAKPILKYGKDHVLYFPAIPWQFGPNTEKQSAEGMCMAATLDYGNGKVAIVSDIQMFCSLKHEATGEKIGMNWKYATQNARFALNLFHWLDGFIE